MDGLLDNPDIKAYLEHCVNEHLTKHLPVQGDNMDGVAMADPVALMAMAQRNQGNGDGFLGGGGTLGGLLIGSLLSRNGGGLFGGGADGGVTAQSQANMSIMSTLGDIKQGVAVSTAQLETSNAQALGATQAQITSAVGAVQGAVGGVKDQVTASMIAMLQGFNGINTAINTDGDRTRSLLTQQYEQTLTRQLSDANAQIIELRGDMNSTNRARQVEVNVTQNVQQMQQQQQVQGILNTLLGELQSIRATNQAINIGAGTLTANPTNTNTNTRVN